MFHRLLALLLVTVGLAGCAPQPSVYTDASACKTSGATTLCFDLASPTATALLLLDAPVPKASEHRIVVLPFGTRNVQRLNDAFNTMGTFDDVTLLTYVRTPGSSRVLGMGLDPMFQGATDTDFGRDALPGTLYYLSAGLKRRFYYNPSAAQTRAPWNRLNELKPDQINTVSLRLPADADVFEGSAKSAKVISEGVSGRSKIKAFDHALLLGANPLPIDVVYQVPPTPTQTLIAESVIKFFGVLLLPLVTVFLLKTDKVRSPAARRWFVGIVATVEVAILGGLVWWLVHARGSIGLNSIFELILVVAGAGLTIWTTLIKKPENAQA